MGEELHEMFRHLFERNMDAFMKTYSGLVISCTSYFDAKENTYHMLFLGMCISLNNLCPILNNKPFDSLKPLNIICDYNKSRRNRMPCN